MSKKKRLWKAPIGQQKPRQNVASGERWETKFQTGPGPAPGGEIPTTERLARALEEARAPQTMIDRARAGYYDDFKSNVADNIGRLVHEATRAGLTNIAMRAIEGEFDSTDWEAREWGQTPEGRAVFKEFGLE